MGASVAEVVAINPNGTKTLLTNGLITFFINGKPAIINGLRKLKFSEDLITFIITFISLFVNVSPGHLEILFLIF